MGTPSGDTAIASNRFQNSGALLFAGTGDVRITAGSTSYYAGASDGGNVFVSNVNGLYFEISGINTTGYSNLVLSFGHYKNTNAGNNELVVEVSADGITYNPLSYSRPAGSGTATWMLVTPSGTIPAATNLRIRFRQTSTSTQFRIDDVKLTGVAATPSISATDPLSAVSTVYGTASTNPTSFTLSGSNLVAGITVTPPGGFEVSATNTNGFAGKGNSILVGSNGTVASTSVFVRLAADTDVGTYSSNIVCSSVGATTASVPALASTVSPKSILVTAESLRKTYGSIDPELTYTSSVVAPFSGSLVRDPGEGVGFYRIRKGDLTAGVNYSISFSESDFEIVRNNLYVTATDITKSFGQTLTLGAGQTGFTTSGLQNNETIGSVTLTASGGTGSLERGGPYILTPSGATGGTFSSQNYNLFYNSGLMSVAPPTLEEWMSIGYPQLSNADRAPGADPDGDGISNLMEYYVGSDPTLPAGSSSSLVKITNRPNNTFSMTYQRAKGVTNVSSTVQATADLSNSSSWGTNGVQETVVDKGSSYDEVTATVTNGPGATKMFMRLKVSQP
jgi:hypothetical protein